MTETAAPAPARAPPSAWSPLQNGLFRSLWIATIVSNVGTWMQDVGSGWLMTSAVALNSVAINASRAIGPALAGVLVAAVGAWLVFILNALSYLGILAVLVRWRREHHKSSLPAERFFSAIRVGLRFVMHTQV